MIRLGVLFALLATFDIGEGVCISCSKKCEGMGGQVAEFRINSDDSRSVACVCKKAGIEDFDSKCTGTMQSGGTAVEFCCSSCGDGEMCTTSIGGNPELEEMPESEKDECEKSEDCGEAADQYCGYHCMEGKCAMYCEGGEQAPPPLGCETSKDCPGTEQCHCEPHGTVRRRLLFAGSKMQKCSCGV